MSDTTKFVQIGILFLLFYCSISTAQVASSNIALANGGAGRAAVRATDINFLNPATLLHVRGRHFYSSSVRDAYIVGLSEQAPDIILPASLAYYQKQFEPQQGFEKILMKEISVASADYLFEKFAFGVTFRHQSFFFDLADTTANQINQDFADLGFIYTPNKNLGLALVAYDAVGGNRQVPKEALPERRVGIAVHYIYKDFIRLRGDLLSGDQNNFKQLTSMLGFEDFIGQWVILRLGFRDDRKDTRQYFTGGIGFDGPRFAINYGFQQDVEEPTLSRHGIDIEFPF